MTENDRLIEAICQDSVPEILETQHELVVTLLSRSFSRSVHLPVAEAPTEQLCPNCHTEPDSDGFCGLCGHQTRRAI